MKSRKITKEIILGKRRKQSKHFPKYGPCNYSKTVSEIQGENNLYIKKAHFNPGNINKAQNVEISYILINYYN